MTHWGWYWKVKKKHLKRVVCSTLARIDSFALYKEGAKKCSTAGFTVEPLQVRAYAYPNHLTITYRNRKEHSYTIAIDKLPCNYGGLRCFFKCPLCHKRMRFLYFGQQSVFLCRRCLNLGYESQRLRPTRRYDHKSDKIKAAVKARGGDIDRCAKPPRMHKANYDRLRRKQFYYESKSHQASNDELRTWYGHKIEPHLDTFFDYVDEGKEWHD